MAEEKKTTGGFFNYFKNLVRNHNENEEENIENENIENIEDITLSTEEYSNNIMNEIKEVDNNIDKLEEAFLIDDYYEKHFNMIDELEKINLIHQNYENISNSFDSNIEKLSLDTFIENMASKELKEELKNPSEHFVQAFNSTTKSKNKLKLNEIKETPSTQEYSNNIINEIQEINQEIETLNTIQIETQPEIKQEPKQEPQETNTENVETKEPKLFEPLYSVPQEQFNNKFIEYCQNANPDELKALIIILHKEPSSLNDNDKNLIKDGLKLRRQNENFIDVHPALRSIIKTNIDNKSSTEEIAALTKINNNSNADNKINNMLFKTALPKTIDNTLNINKDNLNSNEVKNLNNLKANVLNIPIKPTTMTR